MRNLFTIYFFLHVIKIGGDTTTFTFAMFSLTFPSKVKRGNISEHAQSYSFYLATLIVFIDANIKAHQVFF